MRKPLSSAGYDTDKFPPYLRVYEELFAPLLERDIRLLEIGVKKGGSLLLWRDYFPRGRIVGLDVEPVEVPDPTGRIVVFQGLQQDTRLLADIGGKMAPAGFDVIIDDGSHIGEYTRTSFWFLFPRHLKPGGLYVIEDWGTGYWNSWADGLRFGGRTDPPGSAPREASVHETRLGAYVRKALGKLSPAMLARDRGTGGHTAGMVGFIKELVDECAMADITHPTLGTPPFRASQLERLQVTPGQVVVVKARSDNLLGPA
jgi:SAM-dependent methyltransferase